MGVIYLFIDTSYRVASKGSNGSPILERIWESMKHLGKRMDIEKGYIDKFNFFHGVNRIEFEQAKVEEKMEELSKIDVIETKDLMKFWTETIYNAQDEAANFYILTAFISQRQLSVFENKRVSMLEFAEIAPNEAKLLRKSNVYKKVGNKLTEVADILHYSMISQCLTVINFGLQAVAEYVVPLESRTGEDGTPISRITICGSSPISNVDGIRVFSAGFMMPVDQVYGEVAGYLTQFGESFFTDRSCLKNSKKIDTLEGYGQLLKLLRTMNEGQDEQMVLVGCAVEVGTQLKRPAVVRLRGLYEKDKLPEITPEELEKERTIKMIPTERIESDPIEEKPQQPAQLERMYSKKGAERLARKHAEREVRDKEEKVEKVDTKKDKNDETAVNVKKEEKVVKNEAVDKKKKSKKDEGVKDVDKEEQALKEKEDKIAKNKKDKEVKEKREKPVEVKKKEKKEKEKEPTPEPTNERKRRSSRKTVSYADADDDTVFVEDVKPRRNPKRTPVKKEAKRRKIEEEEEVEEPGSEDKKEDVKVEEVPEVKKEIEEEPEVKKEDEEEKEKDVQEEKLENAEESKVEEKMDEGKVKEEVEEGETKEDVEDEEVDEEADEENCIDDQPEYVNGMLIDYDIEVPEGEERDLTQYIQVVLLDMSWKTFLKNSAFDEPTSKEVDTFINTKNEPKASYVTQNTGWHSAEAVSITAQKMLRALYKLPERAPLLQKEIERMAEMCYVSQSSGYAYEFARFLRREIPNMPTMQQLIGEEAAKHFENIGNFL